MKTIRMYASKSFWKYMFSWKMFSTSFLACVGVIWLVIEVSDFFDATLLNSINLWHLLAISFVYASIKTRPKRTYSCRLNGRDTVVELYIGDFFDEKNSALIISSNTSFDTSMDEDLISDKSIQGQFTARYYKGAIANLNHELDRALIGISPIKSDTMKSGKSKVYSMGTIAGVRISNRQVYFVALASMSSDGRAFTKKEDVLSAISELWNYIMEKGGLDVLVIPIVGTGYSRLPDNRDIMVKEIIKSFVAACSSKRFTEKLRIVISCEW